MSTSVPQPSSAGFPRDGRVAVVAARFNAHITDELLRGCIRRLGELGAIESQIQSLRVPGAFELPVTAKVLADTARYAAIICIGAVVRGDTPHFDYVAGECARGCQQVAVQSGIPVIFGVLTTNTEQQALDRTGGSHGHAGERAAEAAVEMIAVVRRIRSE